MPDLQPHTLDLAAARDQVARLRQLLADHPSLQERKQILPFLRGCPDLIALCGTYGRQVRFDLVAWEYPLFNEFLCDFVSGDSVHRVYTLIECEGATPRSLFVPKRAGPSSAWSPHFNHGFSQIADWFYKLQAMTDTPDMEARLGKRSVAYTGLLVAGRDHDLKPGERLRLDWRRNYETINSQKVVCMTYDQLCDDLQFRIDEYTRLAQTLRP